MDQTPKDSVSYLISLEHYAIFLGSRVLNASYGASGGSSLPLQSFTARMLGRKMLNNWGGVGWGGGRIRTTLVLLPRLAPILPLPWRSALKNCYN